MLLQYPSTAETPRMIDYGMGSQLWADVTIDRASLLFALSLARSAEAERDNELCIFVLAAGVHRFIKRYHIKRILTMLQRSIRDCLHLHAIVCCSTAPAARASNLLGKAIADNFIAGQQARPSSYFGRQPPTCDVTLRTRELRIFMLPLP
ncbi:hypothetical protein EVAR_95173_1 [Eumeta japonica]|uniref:Uncharacterized protein n=1 Tax=Eumeta variegata TaxID=151549 RepID=A0A4C1VFX9_EUMVA|nr:hypothetical protein EVAR_95173_1 [Eumeta japonica]